jgi:hypothetical protein
LGLPGSFELSPLLPGALERGTEDFSVAFSSLQSEIALIDGDTLVHQFVKGFGFWEID